LQKEAAGAWKDKDHPELKAGSAAWVKKLRRESGTQLQVFSASEPGGVRFPKVWSVDVQRRRVASAAVWLDDDFNVLIERDEEA